MIVQTVHTNKLIYFFLHLSDIRMKENEAYGQVSHDVTIITRENEAYGQVPHDVTIITRENEAYGTLATAQRKDYEDDCVTVS